MFAQKSVLARLLANENISVQQGNYDTAYFDVKSRVLGLPLWKDMGKDIYDMLVGHEVAHALFTPEDFFDYEGSEGIPHSWLNIVEDVRIEKMILRKYPGLVGNFKRGYKELMLGESDLFTIKDKDLSTFGFMDRLNIHAKARDMIEVPFAADELPFVAQAKACETYADVVKCCIDIQAWLKQKAEDQKDQNGNQPQEGEGEGQKITIGIITDDAPEGGEETTEKPDIIIDMRENKSNDAEAKDEGEGDTAEGEEGEEGDDADEGEGETSTKSGPEPQSGLMDQEVITETSFREKQKTLVEPGAVYAKGMTRQQVQAATVPYDKIAAERKARVNCTSAWGNKGEFPAAEYETFLRETKSVVTLMVKEFEMRKAAYRSLRAREATKGSLDVNKLHKYQYDDMLFKQVSYLADAKSHGMVMLIDYSGSMYNSLPGVIRQTLTLLMFCKRVGIPFEVYSFTSMGDSQIWRENKTAKAAVKPSVTHVIDAELALLKLFDSTMSKRDYDEAFRMMFWQTVSRSVCSSEYEALGNTPLNTALMAMQYIISDFRMKHRIQKTNFIALTDGDSNGISVYNGQDMPVNRRGGYYVIEVNGKMITTQSKGGGYSNGRDVTANLVQAITDMGVATVNYYIASRGYELNGEISRSLGYANKGEVSYKKKIADIRDNGVAVFDNNAGYNRRFVMKADQMNESVFDLEVDSDMSVNKIAKAFTKSNGSKKKSKIVTQKFAELVA